MKKTLIVLFICLLISGLTNCMLGSSGDWDFFSYHYYNAYAVFHGKIGYDIMPAGIQSYLNPFLDIINYSIMKILKNHYRILTFVQGLSWGFLAFLVYLISDLLFSKITGNKYVNGMLILFSTMVGVTECIIVSEIGMSYNDITISVLILTSLYLILKYIDTQKMKYVIWSGLVVGISCGCKLTSGIFIVSLILSLLIINIKKGWYNLKIFFLYSIFVLLGFLIIDGYWMYLLYQKFGNPFYPLFNGIFKSKYYAYINYKDLRYDNIHSLYKCLFYPLIWTDYFTNPNNIVCENKFFDYRHSFAYFSCIFSFLFFGIKFTFKNAITKIEKPQLLIILFTIISYLIWIKTSSILRYLVPLLSLTAIIMVIFMTKIKFLVKNKMITIITLLLLVFILNINYTIPSWGRSYGEFKNIKLPVEENSVVFLVGKPISYVAANSYKNVRFIYLYSGSWDGDSFSFKPTEEYYKLVDKVIKDKKKYVITRKRNNFDIIRRNFEGDDYNQIVKKKYLNSEMKCVQLEDKTEYTADISKVDNFDFCEIIE